MKCRFMAVMVFSLGVMMGLSACDKAAEQNAATDAASSDAPPLEQPVVVAAKPAQPGPVTGSEALPPGHPPFEGMPVALTEQQATSGELPSGHPVLPEQPELPESGIPEDEPAHPVPSEKDLALDLPDSIKGKWAAVGLEVTMTDGAKTEINAPIGGETSLADSGLILRVDTFVPSYKSDFETITSASEALDNPAVKVALIENGQVVTKGWVFQNLPEFNSFVSDRVEVRLLSAVAGNTAQGLDKY